MRQWPNDPTVAHLIFVDHQTVPTREVVESAVEHAWAKGARAIRTSALFPASAAMVASAGFAPIDQLALLQVQLDQTTMRRLGEPRHRTRSMTPWSHHVAAAVDQRAFGPLWGNDAASLRDIRTATPAHRARMVRVGRRLAGFALAGAAADSGYLQRIAVDPEHRRLGIARDLVIDALTWMHADRRLRALVNTGVDNHAALALYEGLGFTRLPDLLTIAERRSPE
ncbi:MAG: GNAT family N-acetyltransferase [Ilumatobacteraceae bacterium]|nr:GNAT family N-acetyltransferase [Ilumatobacteraceae bacterium]